MTNSWLPPWLGDAWTVVFALVLVVHLSHLLSVRGRARLWHAGHVLMALGMVDMYWPAERMAVGRIGGVAVFAGAAVLAAGAAALDRQEGGWRRWWVVSTVDLALMAWMFQMIQTVVAWVTAAAVAWFVVEAAGWVTGRLLPPDRHAADGRYDPEPPTRRGAALPAPCPVPAHGRDGAGSASAIVERVPAVEVGRRPARLDHGELHRVSLRVTLPVMSLGMAYMFAAMQWSGGMAAMTSM